MSRFYVPPEQIRGQGFVLLGTEARHAVLVLRKKIGDVLDLFDGKDLCFQGRVDFIAAERLEGTILSQKLVAPSPRIHLTLCQALIKGPRWDWLVEKACEIGVSRLVPLLTARTVVNPSRESALDRWKRIALAAAKQCGRGDVMDITRPTPFTEAVCDLPQDGLALIAWEKEEQRTIRAVSPSSPAATGSGSLDSPPAPAGNDVRNKPRIVTLFIGPEGGWESQEVEFAVRHGTTPVQLGPTLLRSETAGLVAAILVLHER